MIWFFSWLTNREKNFEAQHYSVGCIIMILERSNQKQSSSIERESSQYNNNMIDAQSLEAKREISVG